MRGALSLVGLLVVVAAIAVYFTTATPELQDSGQYQHIESRANAAAAMMAHDPQAQLDAAMGTNTPASATNAPAPSGN